MKRVRTVALLLELGVALVASTSVALAVGYDVLPEYRDAIESSLERAGSNRAELVRALKTVPADQRKAMQFLVSHMPESDAKTAKADYLLDNVKWAYKARETFPWAMAVPEQVFFNNVLPYASLNERRDDWREDFFTRFGKYVQGAKTQQEALDAINKNIVGEVMVEYGTKRTKPDQSPYESMEEGVASCTGLSILLNNAFRAVGIPARVAGTPAWTSKHGNHNWVEVWTTADQRWHFTEYYPDKNGLDHGWLLADAAQGNAKSLIHSIYASSWKPTGHHFPLVWDMNNKEIPAMNVTKRYVELGGIEEGADACELRIHFTHDGERVEVPVIVFQGDVKLSEGKSPKPTDDMNRYFTAKVRKGQIYQVMWNEPGSGKVKRRSIKSPSDQAWCLVDLNDE